MILESHGSPIGLADDAYEERSVHLEAGDRLYLYSDGVPEAMDPAGEQFGDARLLEAIGRRRAEPLQESVATLLGEIARWHGSESPARRYLHPGGRDLPGTRFPQKPPGMTPGGHLLRRSRVVGSGIFSRQSPMKCSARRCARYRKRMIDAGLRESLALVRELDGDPRAELEVIRAYAGLAQIQSEAGEPAAAVGSLRKSAADGFHDARRLRTEPALEPFQSLPEFALLLLDLEFPADPFTVALR